MSNVFYKPKAETSARVPCFLLMVDEQAYKKWKSDNQVPLIDVVENWGVQVIRDGGHTGKMEHPSNQELEDIFKTSDTTEVIRHILREGELVHNVRMDRDTKIWVK